MKNIKNILSFLTGLSFIVLLCLLTLYVKSYHNLYMEGVSDYRKIFWGYNPSHLFESITLKILDIILSFITLIMAFKFAAKYWRPIPSRY